MGGALEAPANRPELSHAKDEISAARGAVEAAVGGAVINAATQRIVVHACFLKRARGFCCSHSLGLIPRQSGDSFELRNASESNDATQFLIDGLGSSDR